jgi:rhamnulose-1-phosphate aldolase
MHPENVMFVPEGAGFLPFTIPGTEKIAEATTREFERHRTVIWEKHGVLATGKNVLEAFDTIDLLVKAAKIWFYCKSAGYEPEGLSDAQMEEIRKKIPVL